MMSGELFEIDALTMKLNRTLDLDKALEKLKSDAHAGMDHSKMDHSKMDHSKMNHDKADHSKMDHSKMDHDEMDHSKMDDKKEKPEDQVGTLVVIDTASNEIIKVIELGHYPSGVGTNLH